VRKLLQPASLKHRAPELHRHMAKPSRFENDLVRLVENELARRITLQY
jgi:hypothetical protein